MDTNHLVVVGGGYAGVLAALRAQARAPRCRVTLVSASDVFIERIRLHELAATGRPVAHPLRRFLRRGISLHQATAHRVDAGRSVLETSAGELAFDALVLATGSRVRRTAVPGAAEHASVVEHGEMARLHHRLTDASGARHVLVCGGGLTAVECATALARRPDVTVTLVTQGRLEPRLSARGYEALRAAVTRQGVRVHEHATVAELTAGRAVTDAGALDFDECVWACGMEGLPLAADSGLGVNDRGQVLVDANLSPCSGGAPNIFVAGDAAAFAAPPGHRVDMGCKTAMPTGAHAGENAAAVVMGRPPAPFAFRDALYCIALGDGALAQLVEPDGTTGHRIWQGWRAAVTKRAINRFTVWALLAEKRGLLRYRWPRPANRGLLAEPAP
ncbi:MAG: FAD-dependent oxidoreductase [Kofleriaceae bacterium]